MKNNGVDLNEVNAFEHKYKNIVEGTKKIISGDIREVDDLPTIFFNSEYSEIFFKNISNSENFKQNFELINRAYESRSNEKLLKKIEQKNQGRKIKLLYALSSSVAAVIAIISFLTFNGSNSNNSFDEVAQNEVKDLEIFSPTIFTDDNRHITLDTLEKKTTVKELTKLSKSEKVLDKDVVKEQKLIVPSGYTYTIILDDSSEVTLNAASELIYPTAFNDSTRTVKFVGEGYFKIKKGNKPFIVNCNGVEIKVYGTEFNIKSRSNVKLETLLVEGSVGVSVMGGQEVTMEPNQILLYERDCNRVELKTVDVSKYLQWIDGNLNYDKYPLKDVLRDLESWYSVAFDIKHDIDNINITFFSPMERDVAKILNIIEKISNVTFKDKGGDVYIVTNK